MIGPEMMDQGVYVDPQMNNQPLSFNSNKGKPPMPIEGNQPERRIAKLLRLPSANERTPQPQGSKDNMDSTMPMPPMPPENFTSTAGSMGGNMGGNMSGNMGNTMAGNMGGNMGNAMGGGNMGGMMMPGGGQGFFGGPMQGMGPMMGPMMGPGPSPDMMGMGNMMMYGGMGWGGGPMGNDGTMPMMPPREIIRMKNCVLYPPPNNSPMPTTRERPPGCRTIFVGGVPETCTEEMLSEVFAEFGVTTSVRKSKKKNFAHVRFEDETSVDRALFLSGYRMKVEDKDDKTNTGRLHVDFAMARDDQYEFECKQRSLMRDMRHRQRLEEERMRPPSPPPVLQYSDYEASTILESLKSDEDFMKASQVLLTWLERGDVNRRNINTFYSMIQCTNAHVRRLLMEKTGHDEELSKMKDKFRNIFEGILRQFSQIEKVFGTAQKQRNWDHFTKAQRKNIEVWFKQAKEIKQVQQDEFLSDRKEDEMEMSDDEDEGPPKKKKIEYSDSMNNRMAEMAGKLNQINSLRDENDTLKCQLEASKNEIAVLKQESNSSTDDKDKELKALQMAMQGMQQQLIQARKEVAETKKRAELEKNSLLDQMVVSKKDKPIDKSSDNDCEIVEQPRPSLDASSEDKVSSTGLQISDKDMHLIGLVCCFLHVHPTGASIDYIWSYLHRLGISCRVSEVESVLEKFPVIFTQEVSGVGATIERRWHFKCYRNLSVS